MHCADTSFLLSYYGADRNTGAARAQRTTTAEPLHVHALNDFELANALRALVFRKAITPEKKSRWLADFEADKNSGVLIVALLDANAVLRRAETISSARTESSGNRSYDILLVAAAKLLGATHFWSFDARQRELARAEGLLVGP